MGGVWWSIVIWIWHGYCNYQYTAVETRCMGPRGKERKRYRGRTNKEVGREEYEGRQKGVIEQKMTDGSVEVRDGMME